MAKTLLQKLPPSSNKYSIGSVKKINKDLNITAKFQLKPRTEDIVLKLLKNIDIKSRIFTDLCKLAKLKPIFKKRLRMDPFNYRPISLLPLISKIFKKIVHDQMVDYLAQYNILDKY